MKRFCRFYRVLAIESSCDDSAVCIIQRSNPPRLIDHRKRTLNSAKDGGIIPIDAMSHHLSQLAPLVKEVLEENGNPRIDLVCATRGPGMYSSLAAGLQLAKGLSCAWNVPLVGVNHMLGHLLTPGFFPEGPKYPFFSLLVSGGHTMLVLSHSTLEHEIVADTIDNAVGNALDKCARHLGLKGVMLGKELDLFCKGSETIPLELDIPLPLEKSHNQQVLMSAYSFAHFSSLVPRLAEQHGHTPLAEQPESARRAYGQQLQSAIFKHIIRKTQLGITQLVKKGTLQPGQSVDFVVSGGVAANSFLRANLESMQTPLDLKIHRTPLEWCTDNALMIGWAGIEMHEAGYKSTLGCTPLSKWPLDKISEIDGLLN